MKAETLLPLGKLDPGLQAPERGLDYDSIGSDAQLVDRLGYYSLLMEETKDDHFQILSLAESQTSRVKLGTSVVFFASVILAFYTFIFVTFINPEYLENILKVAEQEILNSDPEISDENLDMALSMTQKMLQPQWMITLSVLGGTFMGFFLSLIHI